MAPGLPLERNGDFSLGHAVATEFHETRILVTGPRLVGTRMNAPDLSYVVDRTGLRGWRGDRPTVARAKASRAAWQMSRWVMLW